MDAIKYLLANERDQQWGLSVSSIGSERFGPGDAYPSERHSGSYLFRPNGGRVFDEYQLVYISEGEGYFESASVARTKIVAGTMFLLFPGEWHTFSPEATTGWTQYWIGFKGVNIDLRVENQFLARIPCRRQRYYNQTIQRGHRGRSARSLVLSAAAGRHCQPSPRPGVRARPQPAF